MKWLVILTLIVASCASPQSILPEEPSELFVVCKETITGFSAEEYAANQGATCVDVCPTEHDPYVTQIGVEVCIKHYGIEEISQWPICTKSNNSCNCVKTTETTSDEPIEKPDYKCVPDQYAERLLFRSGQDFLDENGNQAVVIA